MKTRNIILATFLAIITVAFVSCSSGEKKVTQSYGEGATCVEGDCLKVPGKIKFPKGEEYTGEFNNDQISGKGVMSWPNGSKYTGSYEANQRSGAGTVAQAAASESQPASSARTGPARPKAGTSTG